MSQSGFTSIVVLILLIFVSALFLGTGALVELSLRQLRRGEDQDRELRLLREKLVNEGRDEKSRSAKLVAAINARIEDIFQKIT